MEKTVLRQLIEKAKQKDEDALYELYQEAFPNVYYLALRMMKNTQDAEDIAQETFLNVWQNIGTLMDADAFFAWVNIIAANKCREHLRKKGVPLAISDDETVENLTISDLDEALLPQEVLDKAETRKLVMKIIDGLPEAQRLCVLLYYFNNLSVEQVAGVLECSPGTVKSRLSAARSKIRIGVETLEANEGIRLHGAAVSLIPVLQSDAIASAGVAAAETIFSSSIAGAGVASAAAAGAGAASKGIFASVKAWFTGLGTAAKTAVTAATVAVIGTATTAAVILGANSYSTAPIEWQDPAAEQLVRQLIDRPEGNISEKDLAEYTQLTILGDEFILPELSIPYERVPAPENISLEEKLNNNEKDRFIFQEDGSIHDFGELKSIEDFAHFPNLINLSIHCNNIDSFKGISKFATLKYIYFGDCMFTSFESLEKNDILEGFTVDSCYLYNMEGIEKLQNLHILSLSSNYIEDISPIQSLENLSSLTMRSNNIRDISPLNTCTNMRSLLLDNNLIQDISPLAATTKLTVLTLRHNNISDISPLLQMNDLNFLALLRNPIENMELISQLQQLEYLEFGNEEVGDISFLESLQDLEKLSITYTNLENVESIGKMQGLKDLDLRYNDISDISPLANLKQLEKTILNNNNISDFSPLDKLEHLVSADVRYNPGEDNWENPAKNAP